MGTTPIISGYSTDLARLGTVAAQTAAHRRETDKAAIVQHLYRSPCSRADLARALSLPRMRVSDLVAELLAEGLIEESGTKRRPEAGKPATTLRVRDEAFVIFSLDLSDETRFVAVISDLRGRFLYRTEIMVEERRGEDALELAVGLVRHLSAQSDRAPLGLGIGVSGAVSGDSIIRVSARLGWQPTDVAHRLRPEVSCPVYLINDANAAALGFYSLQENSTASLLMVTTAHGIGSGLIIGGALVRGTSGSAGEIGHIVVDESAGPCPCGLSGCLDVVASASHIRRRVLADPDRRTDICDDVARALGQALAPMIGVTGVSDVVISGPVDIIDERFVRLVESTVRARIFADLAAAVSVHLVAAPEHLVLVGIIANVRAEVLGVA